MSDDPIEDYSDEDILHDYLMMAKDFNQDDTDVADYRKELGRRGYTFITTEPEYEENDHTYWEHPSLTVGERNPGLSRRRYK